MRLSSSFIKLPLKFDAQRLAEEALQFPEDEWTYHPLRHDGNTALPLVSAEGEVNDRFFGQMRPTAALQKCPYILQVMASFGTVIGRTRLMRLARGSNVPSHSDGNYSWRNRVRIHIPIITHPDVTFSSIGNIDVHMAEGEAWTFDNWRQHAVYNRSPVDRVHLVVDTVGTSKFWDLLRAGWDPGSPDNGWTGSVRFQPFQPGAVAPGLDFERFNTATVRPPDEVSNMLDELLDDLENFRRSSPLLFEKAADEIERFKQDWRAYWALYWDAKDAIPRYALLAKRLKTRLQPLLENATFDSNEANAYEVAAGWIANTTDATSGASDRDTFAANGTGIAGPAASAPSLEEYVREFNAPAFEQPVFIVAAPRSGSTMLFEALQKNKDLWTIGDESQREVESIPALHPANRGFESNELTANDYTPQIGALLMDAFMSRLQNASGSGYLQTPVEYRPSSVRFLEKTPKNSLRIPFFRQMFPEAKFIFLHREAAPNIASMLDAWLSRKFVTYDDLPDWDGPSWSLLLPPGWRGMRGRPLSEIVAWQWAQTNERIMDDLSRIPRADWTHVSYESLLTNPGETLPALCKFAGIPYGPRMQALANEGFPLSRYTLTAPDDRKWKRHEDDIKSASRLYSSTEKRISDFLATTVSQ
jgi:hypothetical protein